MEITLRVHYGAVYDRYHERFMERVPVSVIELADAEAPIAFDSLFGVTRWFGDRHFRRYTLSNRHSQFHGSSDGPAILSFLQDAKYPRAEGYTCEDALRWKAGNMLSGYFDYRPTHNDRVYSETRYPEVSVSQERAVALEGVRRFASDCFLADGSLWIACSEPKIVLDVSPFIDFREWRTGEWSDDMNSVVPDLRLINASYPADSHADLCTEFGSHLLDRLGEFTVVRPDAFSWNRARSSLIMACRIIIEAAKPHILSIPPEVGEPIFGMHSHLFSRDDAEIDPDHLAGHLERLVSLPASSLFDSARLFEILDTWNSRPVSLAGVPSRAMASP